MDPYLCSLIDQLEQEHTLSASQWIQLLNGRTPELAAYLFENHAVHGSGSTGIRSTSVD